MDSNVIDPRIKEELDCLNSTSENINQLENELSEKRNNYRSALTEATQRLNQLAQKLGDCVSKARPYYEARRLAKQARNETQQAALNYERAVSMHVAAREMVTVAEQGMLKDNNRQDTAWPEMLNHATLKVNEAEIDRFTSEMEHQQKAEAFKKAEDTVNKLEKKLRSNIKKSRLYFETKQHTQAILENISEQVTEGEKKLRDMKHVYSQALQKLEEISDSIHASRESLSEDQQRMLLGERQSGVGAETVPPLEHHPEIRINQDADGVSVNPSVLSDLKKMDSTDHLNGIVLSSSLDNLSLTSDETRSSSQYVLDGEDVTLPLKETFTPSPVAESELSTENTGITAPTTSHSLEPDHTGANPSPLKRKNASKFPAMKKSTSPLLPNQQSRTNSLKESNGEIVLSIAGLGKALSP